MDFRGRAGDEFPHELLLDEVAVDPPFDEYPSRFRLGNVAREFAEFGFSNSEAEGEDLGKLAFPAVTLTHGKPATPTGLAGLV